MSRVRTLLTVIVPSMIAGGLMFGSAFTYAAAGRDDASGLWLASADTASKSDPEIRRARPTRTAQAPQTTPPPPPPPPRVPRTPPPPPQGVPPVPPVPPKPPKAPHGPHHGKHGGVSVTIHDGKVDISGIDGMVRGQLEGVRQMLKNDPNIPKELRDKALARLDKVRVIVDKRLGKIKGKKIDDLGEELEQMGEEIEQAMEGLDEELEKLGEKLGKDYANRLPKDFDFKLDFDHDDDDDDDLGAVPMPDLDGDDDDLRQSITDLKGLALKPAQKAQITKIRADADRSVAVAKQALDAASHKLEVALADPKTSDAEIARYVDQISGHEAVIRKTRILAWVSARRILDAAQRKKIEDAAKKN